jgi:hypothetical protein
MAGAPSPLLEGRRGRPLGVWSKRRSWLISLVVLGVLWGHLGTSQGTSGDDRPIGQSMPLSSPKITPALARTVDRMSSAAITRDTSASHNPEQYSTPLVHVDQHARIQVEIYLNRFDEAALREIQSAGVTVELTNAEHRLVQGWVPFDLLAQVAEIANVRRVRPPDYAIPRSHR